MAARPRHQLAAKARFRRALPLAASASTARYANPGLEINGVEKDFGGGKYGPDLVNDYALDFIDRHADRPFFLYYPMLLTHAPFQPTPDSPDWDPNAEGESVNQAPRHFGEMTSYMDKLVGKVVARLEQHKLRERTLVLFLGDNGTGKNHWSKMGNRVVIGGKGTTTPEGMHVPLPSTRAWSSLSVTTPPESPKSS